MKVFKGFFLAKNVQNRFSTLSWLFWSTFAVYYPMIVVYLRSRDFSNISIGAILAVNSLVIIAALPFWGMVSDYIRSIKKVFIFCFAISICLILTIPLYKTVLLTGIAFAVITFFECSMFALLDIWTLNAIKHDKNIHYGGIRLYGSLGWAVTVPIVALLADKTSINIVFPLFAVIGLMTIFWSFQIIDRKDTGHTPMKNMQIKTLLKNKEYVVLLILSFVIFAPNRGSIFFLPNAIDELGGTQTDYGIAIGILALSEVPAFYFSKILLRYIKPNILILIASIFFILRQLLYFLAESPLHLILIQTTQGLTYGLFLSGMVHYIDEIAPKNLKSTAITIATAVYFGLGSVLGSLWGGWAIDNIGLKGMYISGFYVSIAISVFFLLIIIYKRKKRLCLISDKDFDKVAELD